MTETRKNEGGGNSQRGGENPPVGWEQASRDMRGSLLFPVTSEDGRPLAEALRESSEAPVLIHHARGMMRGTIRRRGVDQPGYELALESELLDGARPFALLAGPFDGWEFPPVRLGQIDRRAAPGGGKVDLHAKAEPVFQLAADGGHPAEVLRVASERIELSVYLGKLMVRVAQPPLRKGEPVVLDIESVQGGQLVRRRVAVALDFLREDGRWQGTADVPEALLTAPWEITARPLRADELQLLGARPLRGLLARQNLLTLPLVARNGVWLGEVRREAEQAAFTDQHAHWYVRVTGGKEVRQ